MDPNATLKEIRDLVQELQLAGDMDQDEYRDFTDLLCLKMESLDNWLENGGFLPSDWQR